MTIQTGNLGTAPSGAGGDTFRSFAAKMNENFTNNTHAACRLVGTAAGNLTEIGLDGWTAGLTTPAYAGGGGIQSLRNGISNWINSRSVLVIKGDLICAELAGDFHLGYARQLTDKSSLLFDLAF